MTIVSLTLPFTFTLKVILLSFVSVISGYFASTLPFSTFNFTGSGLEPAAFKLSFTYSNPFGKSSSIITSVSFPCSTVFLKLIRYSISSSNFGVSLFTVFFASSFPSLYCGVISTFGVSGLFFVSSIIALLTIFSPTFTSSFTFTLKMIFLSSVSVISGYFASTLPFSTFNSTGFGPAPSAFKLFSTYSKPFGKISSIFTSVSFPFSTVFLKLIRYSTSSPNFGVSLFTLFFALIFPSLCNGVIFASGSFESFVSSTIALLMISLPTSASSFTFTLKTILLSFVSVIFSYSAITFPSFTCNLTGAGLSPSAFSLPFTYSKPLGIVSFIFTFSSFPFSTVFLKLIRYSTSSPSFGDGLSTVFFESIIPSLYCGVILSSGLIGGFFVSSTIALLTISLPTFASSFTFTLKTILRSFVSIISIYLALTTPASTVNSTGPGASPSALTLFSIYSRPSGIVSSIRTSASFPFSTVL